MSDNVWIPAFTEKQMAVGKEEFERRLAGLREYAYSDAHPVLTRSIQWEVAYIDSVFERAGVVLGGGNADG